MLKRLLPRSIARRMGLSHVRHLPRFDYPGDVYLVSYPRSGNTWVRFLLGNYLSGNACRFTNCDSFVPDIHFDRAACDQAPRPRVMKSHMPFVPQYGRVIYLVRDVRDVAVSYYHFQRKYGAIPSDLPLADFLHERFNAGKADGMGLWTDHVESWLDRGPRQFQLHRYEDLRRDPVGGLTKMIRFVGLECDPARIEAAVQAASFDSMKKIEKQDHDKFRGLAQTDASVPFVRSGRTGGRDPLLTDELRRELTRVHRPALERLGYLQPDEARNSAA
ncbi:MAG: sulfotransferase domain-containing protein [Phycisphaeraceae bacterium]